MDFICPVCKKHLIVFDEESRQRHIDEHDTIVPSHVIVRGPLYGADQTEWYKKFRATDDEPFKP